MRKILLSLAAGLALSAATVVTAAANPSPNGPGQPGSIPSSTSGGTTCQSVGDTAPSAGSTTSQSPFNFSGSVSGNNYAGNVVRSPNSSAKAVSQYDIACFQASVH
jgi:hypothetical protein